MQKLINNQRGSVVTMAILITFACVGITFVVMQIRQNFKNTSALFDQRLNEHQVIVEIENYFKDNQSCSELLKGKSRGDSLMGHNIKNAPELGQEWKESGWIIKDLYLLRAEDARGWALEGNSKEKVHLKVVMVPKPIEGVKVDMDYLIRAPELVKIISLQVFAAEEKNYSHCKRQKAIDACNAYAHSLGVMAKMDLDREPASLSLNCAAGVSHQVHCLVPHPDAAIYKCNNLK